MTTFRDVDRITVEFKDREGVPSALVVETSADDSAYAELSVTEDGLSFDFLASSQDVPNKAGSFGFKSLEDWELVFKRRGDHLLGEAGQSVAKKGELGPVGKAIVSATLLAILSPVIWIIWDATIRWVQR